VGSFEVADRGEMFPVVVTTSKKGEWEKEKEKRGERLTQRKQYFSHHLRRQSYEKRKLTRACHRSEVYGLMLVRMGKWARKGRCPKPNQ
jgi:hypothetical protein